MSHNRKLFSVYGARDTDGETGTYILLVKISTAVGDGIDLGKDVSLRARVGSQGCVQVT